MSHINPVATCTPLDSRANTLTNGLARPWLQPKADADCWLACVNAICLLFLVVGLIGLKTPQPRIRSLTEFAEVVPVVFIPPVRAPHSTAPEPTAEPSKVQDDLLDAPKVVAVVAADTSPVAFGVPADRLALPTPARFPTGPYEARATTQFSAGLGPLTEATGSYPWPRSYPAQALLRKQQGEVLLLVTVAENGTPSSVTIGTSSGHAVLDGFAADWVRDHWKWPPGPLRKYHVPFKFQLQR